jgi:hypothetical protein
MKSRFNGSPAKPHAPGKRHRPLSFMSLLLAQRIDDCDCQGTGSRLLSAHCNLNLKLNLQSEFGCSG